MGVIRDPTFPETTAGMSHVRQFLHALSLDERRNKFVPEYSNGGRGPGESTNVKEVWFTGSHSDMCVAPSVLFQRLAMLILRLVAAEIRRTSSSTALVHRCVGCFTKQWTKAYG